MMRNLLLATIRTLRGKGPEMPHVWQCPYCPFFLLRSTDGDILEAVVLDHLKKFHG